MVRQLQSTRIGDLEPPPKSSRTILVQITTVKKMGGQRIFQVIELKKEYQSEYFEVSRPRFR